MTRIGMHMPEVVATVFSALVLQAAASAEGVDVMSGENVGERRAANAARGRLFDEGN
jgi:hypothetical protein